MLDELLKYHHEPQDDQFTRQVMGRIRKGARTRQVILWLSGIAGFSLGIGGMLIFQGSLAGFAEALTRQGPFGTPIIGIAAGLVLLGWFLNEAIE